MSISRRDFLGSGAAAAAGLTLVGRASAQPYITVVERQAPRKLLARPAVISSANGLRGVAKAYEMISQGADPLDAAMAGVNIQELDPEDQSVGIGGLPNADGVVQLDASCMHGPTKRAGSVGALEDIATPSLVAKAVMEHTDHIMLVGAGAKKFALDMGFKETQLLTEKSRQEWLRWKAKSDPEHWIGADNEAVKHTHGTINMNAVTASGDIASVTTTSGLSWKLPGRVGDSPIIGAGQYCDNEVGAAGSTGRGEANIKVCGAFLAVELMRQGMSPEQACIKVMERVIAMTEKRLLDERGRPKFDLHYYAIKKDGTYGSACAFQGARSDSLSDKFAICDAKGARLETSAYMYKREERRAG
ncbi:MAG: N(4)-(beta-N-acetylglucosaminyl)-L-asparaginase [Gemmatimonadota bacterium]|nr:N(4)-(beta-N-acetylglucosaminyl)-L-asparaginase [Gemmatimonadota bacterium]